MPFFQVTDAKLTLTRVAAAPALVAEIAKATGRRLEVSKPLATEILMVCVENAGVDEVLAKLAVAASARWTPTENGYRLVADSPVRNIEASAERARRLQTLKAGIEKKRAAYAKSRATDDDEAKAALVGSFLGGGSVDAFVPLLDLATLANMEPGDRVVFASNPNGAQRALDGDAGSIVASWIATHNKSATTMGEGMDAMPDEIAGLMQGPLGERMRRMTQPVGAAPTKLLVVATRGGNALMGGLMPGVRLEARAYGANGALLLNEQGSLDTDLLSMYARLGQAKTAVPATKRTPILYSEDAKALIALSEAGGAPTGGDFSAGFHVPDTLRKRLFAPQTVDPLALIPGEGLAAYAKMRRLPLVACVPDAAYGVGILEKAPETLEEVAEGLKGSGSMRLVPDSTFLVVRAAEPESARRNRLDRDALAALMASVEANDAPGLDPLARFALNSPSPERNPIVRSFLTQFVPTSLFSFSGAPSWDALRLFAVLSTEQRNVLAAGGRVSFAGLDPRGQDAVRGMLYGAQDTLTVEREGKTPEVDPFPSMMRMFMGGNGVDARDEPTEIAPRGLPDAGYLQASVAADTIVSPVGAVGPVYYALGTDELAMFQMLSQGPAGAAMGDRLHLPESGRLGTRTLWQIRGYVGPNAYVSSALADDSTPKDGVAINLKSLPADFQAKIDKKMELFKKSPLGAMMSIGNKAP